MADTSVQNLGGILVREDGSIWGLSHSVFGAADREFCCILVYYQGFCFRRLSLEGVSISSPHVERNQGGTALNPIILATVGQGYETCLSIDRGLQGKSTARCSNIP